MRVIIFDENEKQRDIDYYFSLCGSNLGGFKILFY